MARSKAAVEPEVTPEDVDMSLLTEAPDDWEFETIAEESPTTIIMEVEDVFIGQFIEMEHVEAKEGDRPFDPFDRYRFQGRDEKPYALNKSYKLEDAMKAVNPGQWVRITCVKEIDTGKGNPLKDYRVEVRR